MNAWPAAGHAYYLAVYPAHTVVPPGTESFHCRFFGCKASGVPLHPVRFAVAVALLARSEDTIQKSSSEALDGVPNARNFCDIDPRADDHESCLPITSQ